jgi:hypothetical protein
VDPLELVSNGNGWAQLYYWSLLDLLGPLLLIAIGLGGIKIPFDLLGPAILLVLLGLAGPTINCHGIGWAYQK